MQQHVVDVDAELPSMGSADLAEPMLSEGGPDPSEEPSEEPLYISVSDPDGHTESMLAGVARDPAWVLQHRIAEVEQVPPHRVQLYWLDQVLQPSTTWADAGVADGAQIRWELTQADADTIQVAEDDKAALDELKALFSQIDADKDNQISAAELQAWLEEAGQDLGALSQEEVDRLFSAFDRDGDGGISRAELHYMLANRHLTNLSHSATHTLRSLCRELINNSRSGSKRRVTEIRLGTAATEHKVGCWDGCRRRCLEHTGTLTLLLLTAGFAVLFILDIAAVMDWGMIKWVFLGAACACYVSYLLHTFCCVKASGQLMHVVTGLDALLAIIQAARNRDPSYHWRIECYHYETRTRTVTTTDSDGNTSTSTETYQERCVTHRASTGGRIASQDNSANFVPVTAAPLTQISFTDSISLGGGYQQRKNAWRQANTSDSHQDFSASESLDYEREVLVEWVPDSRPCWMSPGCHTLATFLLLSSCFRWAYDAHCGTQNYCFRKSSQ